ncbi:MAG: hypothetical protein LBJ31_10055 [Treponema sp.]|jgi:hypothetical protein|nr:hypothetical protein [Treponema sp.]
MKTVSALALVIFFALVIQANALYSAAVLRFAAASREDYRERERVYAALDEIAEDFTTLLGESYDDYRSAALRSLASSYTGLSIEDAGGVKLDFCTDRVLSAPEFAPFFFASGSADAFIARRNAFGLTTDKEDWKALLTEDGYACASGYGWLGEGDEESFAARYLAVSHGAELFPVANRLSGVNVNTVNPKALYPIIASSKPPLVDGKTKARDLAAAAASGPVTKELLARVLDAEPDHEIFKALAVRTGFWKITLKVEGKRYTGTGIVAALPEKESDAVKEYRLIERRLVRAR